MRLLSWLGSTILFFIFVGALGGPTEGDAAESVYSTWSIAHGSLACAYPPGTFHVNEIANPFAFTAPLYPLVSGLLSFIFRIGHTVAFPSTQRLGVDCSTAFEAMYKWSVQSGAALPTVRLSYLVWFVLLVGVIVLVRSIRLGGTGWELLAALLLACTTPVLMCIVEFFHPQDDLAMGLLLIALGLFFRQRWFWTGVLIGLAFAAQQFALIVAAPLLVLTPAKHRLHYLVGSLVAVMSIDLPMILATKGRAVKTIIFGSSRVGENFRSFGGTVLWELDLHGVASFLVSRALPIVLAGAVTWLVAQRLGTNTFNPVVVMSVVTTSLLLRLIFEVNLFGYYFLATAVSLVALEIANRRLRGETIAWLGLVTLAFNPVHFGFFSNWTPWDEHLYYALPIALLIIALGSVVYDLFHRRVRIYKYLWILIVALTCESKIFGRVITYIQLPHWAWQVILVPTALGLTVTPLVTIMQKTNSINHSDVAVIDTRAVG